MNSENYCRVYGLFQGSEYYPWGENGQCPTFDICSCCGVTFGYEDCSAESTKRIREQWMLDGTPWFDKKEKPLNWSLEEQLKNIPENFK